MNSDHTYRYVVIPARPGLHSCPVDLYTRLFSHWRSFWNSEYRSYGSSDADPNDFFRQDKFTAILDGDRIVATHSLTTFDLNFPLDEYSYFGDMHSPQTLMHLRENGQNRFNVLQFFMVDPEYSPRKTRMNLGAVMVALSLKHQQGLDGSLSAARTEVAAASLAMKLGFEQISESHLVHNVMVASYFCKKAVPYRRDEENQLVEKLWNSRIDYTRYGGLYVSSSRVA